MEICVDFLILVGFGFWFLVLENHHFLVSLSVSVIDRSQSSVIINALNQTNKFNFYQNTAGLKMNAPSYFVIHLLTSTGTKTFK